ncbi:MAG TPA: FAD-dependent oxidoreductase, partial [Candidatus Methylomirabilis sp.]|nr:FAD-dependent oxidoreductase [Candidatus Methylomirabilis sp.]
MTKRYDLIVIGTGVAATTAASECRNAGWEVAVIDSRPFGGTCVLRGCEPKKVLVGAEEAIDWNRRLNGKGVRGEHTSIDWAELMRFKRTFTDPVPRVIKEEFLNAGIDAYQDRARFVGPTAVQVGTKILEGRYVLIAAG